MPRGVKFRVKSLPLVKQFEDEIMAGKRGTTRAIRVSGKDLKERWRAQALGAGFGRRLANTFRDKTYPRSGASLRPKALVYTRASPIVAAHDEGGTIRGKSGPLAIPLPAAGKLPGGEHPTPEKWERARGLKLVAVKAKGRVYLAARSVLGRGGTASRSRARTARGAARARGLRKFRAIFLLKRSVRLPKRLNLDRSVRNVADLIPERIIRFWR